MMKVRDVVDLLEPGVHVTITDKRENVLEGECVDYLTADFLECEVDTISVENTCLWPNIVICVKSLDGALLSD